MTRHHNETSSISNTSAPTVSPRRAIVYQYQHAIAGFMGGLTATVFLHPLDLVKTRFQVQDNSTVCRGPRPIYRNTMHALMTIGRMEGFRNLYQGLSANAFGSGMAWGMYFFTYDCIKSWLRQRDIDDVHRNQHHKLSPIKHMSAATISGVSVLAVTNPIWVVKTRMCLQVNGVSDVIYRNVFHGLWSLFRTEGLRGAYKGFIPGLFGTSHGAVQFMAYEELKHLLLPEGVNSTNNKLSPFQYIGMAAISKCLATMATYPYQVVRSRLQEQPPRYTSAGDVLSRVVRIEGIGGLYRGMITNLLRVTPACCITFLVYEEVAHFLSPTTIAISKD